MYDWLGRFFLGMFLLKLFLYCLVWTETCGCQQRHSDTVAKQLWQAWRYERSHKKADEWVESSVVHFMSMGKAEFYQFTSSHLSEWFKFNMLWAFTFFFFLVNNEFMGFLFMCLIVAGFFEILRVFYFSKVMAPMCKHILFTTFFWEFSFSIAYFRFYLVTSNLHFWHLFLWSTLFRSLFSSAIFRGFLVVLCVKFRHKISRLWLPKKQEILHWYREKKGVCS